MQQVQQRLLTLFHDDHELREFLPLIEHLLEGIHPNSKEMKSASDLLDEIIDKINSKTGNSIDMNFYPSDNTVNCQEKCLGIATKGYDYKRDEKKNRTGFKGLIKDIVKYWISCGSVNKSTVLLTTEWREKAFKDDWSAIVDTYKKQGKKIIIIEFGGIDSYIVRYR